MNAYLCPDCQVGLKFDHENPAPAVDAAGGIHVTTGKCPSCEGLFGRRYGTVVPVTPTGDSFRWVNKGREIVSIEWYSHRLEWHGLVYDDGDYERVPGGLEDAAALAESLKLVLMPDTVGMA